MMTFWRTLLLGILCVVALFTFACSDDHGDRPGLTSGVSPDIGIGPTISSGSSGGAGLCDDEEPNNSASRATRLEVDPISSRICEGDEDWFTFDTVRSGPILLSLIFSHDEGDLDIILYDDQLRELVRAESSDDNEQVELPNTEPGTYFVKVYPYELAVAPYVLEVQRSAPQECVEDALEPNNTNEEATSIAIGDARAASLCEGDVDVFQITPEPNIPLQVLLNFQHAQGNLELALLDAQGNRLASSASATDGEEVRYLPPNRDPLFVHVTGYAGASTSYVVRSVQSDDLPPVENVHILVGRVRFEDPVFDFDVGTRTFIWSPLPSVLIEVRSSDNNALLASTKTRLDGSFEAPYQGAGHSSIYVRGVAQGDVDGSAFRVVTNRREAYAVRSAQTVTPGVDNPGRIDLDIPSEDNISSPFNVFASTREGLAAWFEVAPPLGPLDAFDLVWEDRKQFACGTCYRHSDSPPTVYLYGLVDDNDALDDPVILHEVGHFIQNQYSRDDSPGGAHDGTPTDPKLAWAEGWATFFSCLVRGETYYYDTLGGWYSFHELEDPDPDYGLFSGQRDTDVISEYFVASLLWDIHDDTQTEDPVFLRTSSLAPNLSALVTSRITYGVAGIDLVDFLHTAVCTEPDALQPMTELLDARNFPHALQISSQVCPKPRPPLRWVSDKDPISSQARLGVYTARPLDELALVMCSPSGSCSPALSSGPLQAETTFWLPETFDVVSLLQQGYSWEARAKREALIWSLPPYRKDASNDADWKRPAFAQVPVSTQDGTPTVEVTINAPSH